MNGRYLSVAGVVLFGAGVVCGRLLHPTAGAVGPLKTGAVRTQPEAVNPQPYSETEPESARAEVERLTSALDAERQRTAALEKKAGETARLGRRVKQAQQRIYQDGAGWIRMETHDLDFVGGLEPTPGLLEYLGLSESQAAEFKSVCAETMTRVAAWEKEHAKVVEQTTSAVTYEIPAMGKEEKQRFDSSVARLLPADDASMVSGLAEGMFLGGTHDMRLSISAAIGENGETNYTLAYALLGRDGTQKASGRHQTIRSDDPNLGRWKHLFRFGSDAGR